MPSDATPADIAQAARRHVVDGLKATHLRVKQACRRFQQLDAGTGAVERQALVVHVLDELTVHAALEQELLYPALREAAGAHARLVEAAERNLVELHALINPLRTLKPEDEQHAARFVALCQRALAHMKWEEARLFPGLESLAVDWARLEGGMDQRREELVVADAPVVAPT